MNGQAALRIDVLDSFAAMQHQLGDLEQTMAHDHVLTAFLAAHPDVRSGKTLRTIGIEDIATWTYQDDQDPKSILLSIGFFGASPETINAVTQLNEAKRHFKHSMLALKAAKIALDDTEIATGFQTLLGNMQGYQTTRPQLRKMGLARLHLKQCYRIIPCLARAPSKIAWTWANTRAIKKITQQQALAALEKKGQDYGIEQQIKRLAALPPGEPLAIVQKLAPHMRTNVVFGDKSTGVERCMLKGSLPLFFPCISGRSCAHF